MYSKKIFSAQIIEAFKDYFGSVYYEIILEYLNTVTNTIVYGIFLYFILSVSNYLFFFVLNKKKYLPSFDKQMYDKLKIAEDIKQSVIDIAVQSWLVSFN